MLNKTLLVVAGAATLGAGVWLLRGATPDAGPAPIVNTAMHGAAAGAAATPANEIIVPRLTAPAALGQEFFTARCAACHGANAAGSENGPPLIHPIYEPSHHGDFAFVSAARNGVRAHHWRFGDMKPVANVTDAQLGWIIAYVREVQRANGVE